VCTRSEMPGLVAHVTQDKPIIKIEVLDGKVHAYITQVIE